jgi:hypothetical protein
MCQPRSGSNFLQEILNRLLPKTRHSATYSSPSTSDPQLLSIKSHAASFPGLLNELSIYSPTQFLLPGKFILIWRDPRLCIISGFEYVRRKVAISQNDYLDSFYRPASFGLPFDCIIENYKNFINNWQISASSSLMHIHYENLMKFPRREIARVMSFLNCQWDSSLKLDVMMKEISYSLQKKMSDSEDFSSFDPILKQYFSEYKSLSEYSPLVSRVNEEMQEFIPKLGYSFKNLGQLQSESL